MKYLGPIVIILSFIAIAQMANISAHNTVDFHTGQTASYSGIAGEDADIDGADKSYTQNGCGSGTVVDNQTNLCWQRDDSQSGGMTWQAALDACNATTTAGHTDWRLPTRGEAISMLDYSCDDTVRPHCQSDFNNNALNWVNGAANGYWTSTTRADDTAVAYAILASVGYLSLNAKTSSKFVRCVRQAN